MNSELITVLTLLKIRRIAISNNLDISVIDKRLEKCMK